MAGRPTNGLAYSKQPWFKTGGREARSELTELQKEFLEFLLDPSADKGSQKEWVRTHDVAERTVINWKKNKLFREHWERRAAEVNGGPERIQKVVDAMFDAAVGGDVKAMTAYLNYVEKFAPTPVNRRELDLSDLSDEELADLAENVVKMRQQAS